MRFLKIVLKERGITAYKVAQDTGITTATLSSWKKGRYTPKREKLQKIADYFGVTVDYLMTGKEEPKEKKSELTARDERDIAKDLNSIMEKLRNGEDRALQVLKELTYRKMIWSSSPDRSSLCYAV